MPKIESLGIVRLEALHYYVHDLARSRRFYTDKFDFAEVGASTPELEKNGKQRSLVFEAGQVRVVVSEPAGEGGRAWRWLKRHPDGVGALVFEVKDIEATLEQLRAEGLRLVDETPRRGPHGLVAFVHPKATHGTMIELLQKDHPS